MFTFLHSDRQRLGDPNHIVSLAVCSLPFVVFCSLLMLGIFYFTLLAHSFLILDIKGRVNTHSRTHTKEVLWVCNHIMYDIGSW